jgi:hypothetical protein
VDAQADVYKIELICQSKPFKKQKWQLELSSQQVGLRDAEGVHVLVDLPEIAAARVAVPDPGSETGNLGVVLGETSLDFKIAKQDLNVVRQYFDTVMVASGHEAITAVRKISISRLVKGVLCLVVCSAILVPTLVAGKANGEATRWLFIGAITGLVMTFQGIAGLRRHRKMVAMQKEAVGY